MRPLPRMPNRRLRTVARQVDEALQRQPAGIDVVEHDGHQRLHAGHAGMAVRIGVVLFLARVRGVVRAQHIHHAVARPPPRWPGGAARRAPAGSSARRCRGARSTRARPASGDAASPPRWPSPCGRPGTPSPRPSRRAARARACRAARRAAPGAAWRSAPPARRATPDARRDRRAGAGACAPSAAPRPRHGRPRGGRSSR